MSSTSSTGFGPLETPVHRAEDIPDMEEVGIAWRDNAVFVFWDAATSTYGQIHVSTTPNGEGSRARCAFRVAERDFQINEPLDAGTFDSESITIDLAGKIRVDHPKLQLDLTIEPLFRPVDWASLQALPEARPGMTLHHYEHGFRSNGRGVLHGHEFSFGGTGWRDRTWGYREESKQWAEYFYLCSVFEEQYAIVLFKVLGADGRIRTFAAKVSGDEQTPISSFEVVRDAAANYAGGSVELPDGPMTIAVLPKEYPFEGWWLPMGRTRQTGPTFGEFDNYVLLEAGDGCRGGGVSALGSLRSIV